MSKKLVMFDFDGVLVNTLESSYQIHKDVNDYLTWEKFQDFSNGNFHDGIMKAVEDGMHKLPENFWEVYDKNIVHLNIHEILRQTLIDLNKDYVVTIVSSMRTDLIQKFLNKEKIENNFADIMGVDFNKSKVVKINTLLDKYKVAPKDAVFITDSLGDVLEANECGVKSIGVLWGLHPRETLEKGKPAHIIDNLLFLLDAVKEVLG